MNILISNDDGIYSEGIFALANVLSKSNNVIVVAPKNNMSACSHSLSIGKELFFEECNLSTKFKSYSLTGTPADCVKFAVHYFKNIKFDLVCSGINKGSNLGSDILYSGTISACVEANFFNIKAISFSNVSHGINKFDENAKWLYKSFNSIFSYADSRYTLNVNFPNINSANIKGCKFAHLGEQYYSDYYKPLKSGGYMLVGEQCSTDQQESSDVYLTKQGYVSITPLLYDRTHFKLINKYKDIEL